MCIPTHSPSTVKVDFTQTCTDFHQQRIIWEADNLDKYQDTAAKALLQLSCDTPQVRDCRQHEPEHLGEQERINNKVKNDCSYKQTSSSLGFAPKTSKARLTWNRIDLAQKVIFSQRLFKFLVLLRHTLLQSSKAVMISLSLVSGVKKSFVCSILKLIFNNSNPE